MSNIYIYVIFFNVTGQSFEERALQKIVENRYII